MSLRRALSLALLVSVPMISLACGETVRPDGGSGLLEVGAQAPDLRAEAHDGTKVALRSLGKPAVIYFYPADETPGCTKEACAFRDVWPAYEAAGVQVIGVSTQDQASHEAFALAHELPFPLVSDTEETWAAAFGVPVKVGYTQRVSFLLDARGVVAKVYPDVDPGLHAGEVLDHAAEL